MNSSTIEENQVNQILDEKYLSCSFEELKVSSAFFSNGLLCIKTSSKQYLKINPNREMVELGYEVDLVGNIHPVNIVYSYMLNEKGKQDASPKSISESNENFRPSAGEN